MKASRPRLRTVLTGIAALALLMGTIVLATTLSSPSKRTQPATRAPGAVTPGAVTPGAVTPGAVTPGRPLGVPGRWTLAFDDEFSGNSLDTKHVWEPNFDTHGGPPGPHLIAWYHGNCTNPAEARVSGGALHLLARSKPCTDAIGTSHQYDSALVNTAWSHTFTGGYFEARMYLPVNSNGQLVDFPAFWLTNTERWPDNGEIDVMEVLNRRNCGSDWSGPDVALGFHYIYGSDPNNPITLGSCIALPHPAGWHTFGADWQPGRSITFYYDGKWVGQITKGISSQPMFIVLNNTIDPTIGGPAASPSDVLVDYVRAWQRR